MKRDEIMKDMAAILLTLWETEGHWAPSTAVYLALGRSLDEYNTILHIMERAGLVTVAGGEVVTLTDEGMGRADTLDKALAK